jgi:hypothetical protein
MSFYYCRMEDIEFFYCDMTYRDALLETSLKLKYFIDRLHIGIFQIAMTGELKEWSDMVPIGESHQVSMEAFEGCNDDNVSSMVRLLKIVDKKYKCFLEENYICEWQIKEYEDVKYGWASAGDEFPDDCPYDDMDEDDDLPF